MPSGPAISNGRIYFGSYDGNVYCLSLNGQYQRHSRLRLYFRRRLRSIFSNAGRIRSKSFSVETKTR